jgi:hypothetical protein
MAWSRIRTLFGAPGRRLFRSKFLFYNLLRENAALAPELRIPESIVSVSITV